MTSKKRLLRLLDKHILTEAGMKDVYEAIDLFDICEIRDCLATFEKLGSTAGIRYFTACAAYVRSPKLQSAQLANMTGEKLSMNKAYFKHKINKALNKRLYGGKWHSGMRAAMLDLVEQAYKLGVEAPVIGESHNTFGGKL